MSEQDAVRERLRALGAADHVVASGLEGLVASWERFADAVERGYALGLDDYRNDLDARTLLQRALAAVPPRARVRDRIRKADVRVKKLTRASERCVWGSRAARENDWTAKTHWWLFAVPKSSDGELASELERVR